MSDSDFILFNSTKAIAGSAEAVHLLEQKERLEQAVVRKDSALALDMAKTFLESIFKTILSDRLDNPNLDQNMNSLYRSVRDNLPLNHDADAAEILKRLTNSIVHNVNELRNRFGAASHGDDGYFENPIEVAEAEMVAQVVDGMIGFLYRKHKDQGDPELAARIYYRDYSEFNDYLDGQREGYKIVLDDERAIDLSPSYLLFAADEQAYRELLLQFLSAEAEEQVEESPPVSIVEYGQLSQREEPEAEMLPPEDGVKQIKLAMVVDGTVQHSVEEADLDQLAEFVVDYARNQAGVDWQNRESLKATFRTILRKKFKAAFPNESLSSVIDAVIQKAAKLYPSRMGAAND